MRVILGIRGLKLTVIWPLIRFVLVLQVLLPLQAHAQRSPADSAIFLVQAGLNEYRQGSRESMERSIELFQQALSPLRDSHNQRGEAATLNYMGSIYQTLGRLDPAMEYFVRALAIRRAVADRQGEAVSLRNIGSVHRERGQPDSALAYYAAALRLVHEEGDRRTEGAVLNDIGSVHQAMGHADSALVYTSAALAIAHEVGDRRGEGATLSNLGAIHQTMNHPDSALHYLARAIPIQREAGDLRGVGVSSSKIGAVYWELGHGDSALVYLTTALPALHDSGDRNTESFTLNLLGVIYQARGSADSARVFFARTLTIYREAGNLGSEGDALQHLGGVYHDLGRADSALAYYARALLIRRAVRDRRGEVDALHNLGAAYYDLGHADSALAYYAQALSIRHEVGDRRGEAGTLHNMGYVHSNLGHVDSALIYFGRALAIQRERGDRSWESAMLGSIAALQYELGRADSALTYYAQVLSLDRQAKDRRGEGGTLNNIGVVYENLGSSDSALVYFRQALGMRREVGDRRGEGVTLSNIGAVHQDLGRADSALAYYRAALAIQREVGDRNGEAATLNNMGSALKNLNHADSTLVLYARALAVTREVGDRRGESSTLSNLGFLYHRIPALRDLGRAVAYYDSAATVDADLYRSVGIDQNRLSFAEQGVGLSQMWVLAWLARASEVGEHSAASAALAASERGRARALRELMRRNVIDSPDVGRAGGGHVRPGADLPTEGRALASAVARTGVPTISYLVTRDTLLAFLIRPGHEVEIFRTAVVSDTLAALIKNMRNGLEVTSDTWQSPAVRLSSLLLPVELRANLPDSGELVIVPSGSLFLLPFAALPLSQHVQAQDSAAFLGFRYAIRYAPSLQVLVDIEARQARLPPTGEPLVVGGPAMPRLRGEDGIDFVPTRLPGMEAEGRWVAGRLGAAVLTDSEATEATVRMRLGMATLVHLATHARTYASDARGRDSYIALAPGAGEDGRLTVGEVLDAVPELKAELVVLSACQTGLGDLKQAEGTVGLQRAFLARGARGVLVSLWSVGDRAALLLMQRFYTHWLDGDSRAEALRRAQAEVAANSNFNHPRYWAAFQMVGAH